MARLESQIKLGHYPTPSQTRDLLTQILTADPNPESQDAKLHVFDPCCGTGETLAQISQTLRHTFPITSYGVELDRARAAVSRARLDHTVHCSIFDLTATKECMSLILLNPPYDQDFRIGTRATRLEKTFFKETIDYLAPKGILVLIIPEQALEPFLTRSITYRFSNVRAFRLPAQEYQQFRQIVIFGQRKEKGCFDAETADALLRQLPRLPYLSNEANFTYHLPYTAGPKIFRDAHPTIDEMQLELPSSPLKKFTDQIFAAPETITSLNPLLPLTMGHLATLLMAGIMNGLITKGTEKIVVKGFTQQCKETRNEQVDASTVKVIETTKTKASVRFFDAKGSLHNVE